MKSFSFPLLLLAVLSFATVGCGGAATDTGTDGGDTATESSEEDNGHEGHTEEGGSEEKEDADEES